MKKDKELINIKRNMKLINIQKRKGMRETKKLEFLLKLGSHQKLPSKLETRRLHLKRGELDLKGPNQLLHNKKKSLEGI